MKGSAAVVKTNQKSDEVGQNIHYICKSCAFVEMRRMGFVSDMCLVMAKIKTGQTDQEQDGSKLMDTDI